MIVVEDVGGIFGFDPGDLRPGGGLPIVFVLFLRNPGGKCLAKMGGQGVDVGFVHFAKVGEFLVGFGGGEKDGTVFGQFGANLMQGFGGQAVFGERARRGAKDLAEIDDGVTSDGEGELGLLGAAAFDAGDGESAGIENRGKGSDPGLVVVLRAEIGEHRVRKMGFQKLGAPVLPLF